MGASCDDSFDSHITIHSKATSFCVLLYVVCISFAVHAPLTHILKHTKPSFTLFYFPLIPFTHSLESCARARSLARECVSALRAHESNINGINYTYRIRFIQIGFRIYKII